MQYIYVRGSKIFFRPIGFIAPQDFLIMCWYIGIT